MDQFNATSIYSQVSYPWGLLLHFPPLQLWPCRIFHSRIFSRPKMTSCRFSRWRISVILDCRDPIMGSLKSPVKLTYLPIGRDIIALNCLIFEKKCVFGFWRQDPRWRISTILDFRGPIIGSLKSLCTTSYRSSMATVALNCLVFEKIVFFCILATDKQTNRRTNRWTAPMH